MSGSFTIFNADVGCRDIQAITSVEGDLAGRVSIGGAVALPWDTSQSVGFTVNTAGLSVGTYTSQVTLTDSQLSTNSVVVPITVTITPASHPTFDLGVTASQSVMQVQSGQTVTYTFTYTNTGPNDCVDADMTAVIPSDLTVNSVTSSNGLAIQQTAGSIDDFGPLSVGDIVVVSVQCTANSTSASDTATITAGVSPFNFVTGTDPNSSNDSASVTTTIVASTPQSTTYTGVFFNGPGPMRAAIPSRVRVR